MGIGFSLFLIVVGAIMRYAVSVSTNGFNIHTAGTIAMIVGIIGLIVSFFTWGVPWGSDSGTRRSRVVEGPSGTVRETEDTHRF